MKLLFKSLIFFIVCFNVLRADYCQDIFDDLKIIIQKADGIEGELESVIPFPIREVLSLTRCTLFAPIRENNLF